MYCDTNNVTRLYTLYEQRYTTAYSNVCYKNIDSIFVSLLL